MTKLEVLEAAQAAMVEFITNVECIESAEVTEEDDNLKADKILEEFFKYLKVFNDKVEPFRN